MNLQKTTIAILATLLATSFALADEFKTVDGKEYNLIRMSGFTFILPSSFLAVLIL